MKSYNTSLMKKSIFFMLVILLSPPGYSQLWKLRRLEIIASAGSTHFSGDIGGKAGGNYRYTMRDLLFWQTGVNFNAGARYMLLRNFAAHGGFSFGKFNSVDIRGSMRSLKSGTLFFEPSLTGEIYFIKNKAENSYSLLRGHDYHQFPFGSRIDAYIYGGIGGILYQVTPNEILDPILTQANGTAMVVPMGIGANVFLSSRWSAGADAGLRFTSTDNLDGYGSSTATTNDAYFFLNLTLARKFRTVRVPDF